MSKPLTPDQQRVLTSIEQVQKQYGSPLGQKTHALRLGITHRRLRTIVGELVKLGYPLISKPDELFLATKPEEVQAYNRYWRRHALGILQHLAKLNQTTIAHQVELLNFENETEDN